MPKTNRQPVSVRLDSNFGLSPEQIEEIERRMADDGPYATDEEVRKLFARLTK